MSRDLPQSPLAAALAAAAARARAAGALQPIATRYECIEDEGLVFLLRVVENLQRKAQALASAPAAWKPANPFLPPEPALFVAELSATHRLLLNKYNVIDGHALVVTRAFAEQESPLDTDDFAATRTVLRELDGLVFYNAGASSGASQRHKHLQRVPWPLHTSVSPWNPADWPGPARQRRPWPFPHAWAPLAADVDAEALRRDYEALLAALGLGATGDGYSDYNLLLTRRWMLAVRRRCEGEGGLSVNALGFAGTLLLKSEDQRARLQTLRPLQLLRAVSA